MAADSDRYESWYAESLWTLLPEVYRASDSADFGARGPLRELVERIGVQMAVVRRSIDRMWDDQSIESCDDWVIPYAGDLVAAKLVSALDARGQRLQVAKAIYYRRRAGTVAILEEAARDVTGWETFVVELFRRLGRTRHNFDPPIGRPADERDPAAAARLQIAQKLVGRASGTPAGGWADLRNVYAASRAQTAFDEYAHTADVRKGGDRTGWHNIPRLGVFVWRLHCFPESAEDPNGLLTTPVAAPAPCEAYYTFDPTGREAPLFAELSRNETSYGSRWVSPDEWQLPGPIDKRLLENDATRLYAHVVLGKLVPASLGVFRTNVNDLLPFDKATLEIDPERGRLHVKAANRTNLRVFFHHGSAGRIGAGAYDRRLVANELAPVVGTEKVVTGGGAAFKDALPLALASGTGTVTIDDSLTYDEVVDVSAIENVTLRCDNGKRALIRAAAGTSWKLTGNQDAELRMEGLFLSGGDLVLAGDYKRVTISFSTLDPGSANTRGGGSLFAKSIDGRDLVPTAIWIEGTIDTLHVRSSITGPIRTLNAGKLEHLVIEESIVQGMASNALGFSAGDARIIRSTILGNAALHRVDVSESILHGIVEVDDEQHGCVRFSAWAGGSVLPRKYASAEIPPRAEIFTSTVFGNPGYGQLRRDADRVVLPPPPASVTPRRSIREGAENGSEMGAFYAEMNAVRERSLQLKLQELMPLGLVPVLVPVT